MVEHIKEMTKMGFRYTRRDVIKLANDVIHENDPSSAKNVSTKWYRCFMKRWPDLAVLQPQALSIPRAKQQKLHNILINCMIY